MEESPKVCFYLWYTHFLSFRSVGLTTCWTLCACSVSQKWKVFVFENQKYLQNFSLMSQFSFQLLFCRQVHLAKVGYSDASGLRIFSIGEIIVGIGVTSCSKVTLVSSIKLQNEFFRDLREILLGQVVCSFSHAVFSSQNVVEWDAVEE